MWPEGFSLRMIGRNDCHKCSAFRQYLDQSNYAYEYFDADRDEVQEQLDKWMITDMPVLQILRSGQSVHQFLPGLKSTKTILAMMNSLRVKQG